MSERTSIKVFAPATVSNVGPGFDVLGFPLENIGEEITLTKRSDQQLVLTCNGADLPSNPDKNVAAVAIRALCDAKEYSLGFDIQIDKHFTPGSGLGSSASSAVGAVFALNELMNWGMSRTDLIPYALKGEFVASESAHADNVAPCMLGGFVGVTSYAPFDAYQIPFPSDLKIILILPDVIVKTAEARAILPQELSLAKSIQQIGAMGGLVTGLATSDYDRIAKSLNDEIATPFRKQLIPGFEEVQQKAMKFGALGCNISGSGPAIFTFFRDSQDTSEFYKSIKKSYSERHIDVNFYKSKINPRGVELA